jgi:Ni/Co efflux regulator RcnB
MKYMITAALALCLLGGAAAAQDRDHDHGRGGEGRQGGGQEHRGGGGAPQGGGREFRGGPQGAPQGAPQAGPQGAPQPHGFRGGPQNVQAPAPQVQAPAPQAVAPPAQRFEGRPGGEGRRAEGYRGGREEFRGGVQAQAQAPRQEFRGGGVPVPGPGYRGGVYRGGDRNFRPGYYAADHGYRGGGHFRVAPYRYPVGYSYTRWGFGAFLPFVFLAPDYTLYQYWDYGLPAPPPDYHWIRVGPDALLVRYGDGYILDVVYGIFF